jgi:hypothetical protein
MPGRPEVDATSGDTPLVEHRVGGGIVRLSAAASHELEAPVPGGSDVTVILDEGLVWANIDGGPALEIRHGPTVLRTSAVQMMVDASPGGDALVVVIEGQVEVATPTVSAKRLAAGAAGQLSASGAITEVAGITEPELAADPWAQANRRLDAEMLSTQTGTRADSEDSEPPDSESTIEIGDAPSDVGRRRRLEVAGLLGLAVLLIVAVLAFVLTRHDSKGSSVKTTTSGRSGSTAPRTAAPGTTVHPTSRPGRGVLTSCRQPAPNRVVVAGRTFDPSRKARAYGLRVILVSPAGTRLAKAEKLIAARPRGASTPWVLPVTVPRRFAGSPATCRLAGIDAID